MNFHRLSSVLLVAALSASSNGVFAAEKRIAYAKSLNVEITGEEAWCNDQVASMTFKADDFFYASDNFKNLMFKVGKSVLKSDCPSATVVDIQGLTHTGTLVFEGSASQANDWMPIKKPEKVLIAEIPNDSTEGDDLDALFGDPEADLDSINELEASDGSENIEHDNIEYNEEAPKVAEKSKRDFQISCGAVEGEDRFKIIDDQVALDRITSLAWFRCPAGQKVRHGSCTGSIDKYSHEDAQEKFNNLFVMPSRIEVDHLLECSDGKLDNYAFPSFSKGMYWSRRSLDENTAEVVFSDMIEASKNKRAGAYLVSRFRLASPISE